MSKQDNIAAQEHLAEKVNAGNIEAFFTELTTAFHRAHR